MYNMKSLLATLTLGLAISTQAYAMPNGDMKAEIDTNGDGQISRDEAKAAKAKRFADIDTDGNGSISFAELETHALAKKAERKNSHLEKLDTDGNGLITQAEFVNMRPNSPEQVAVNMFKLADTDSSGDVSPAELEALHANKLGKKFAHMDTDGDGQLSSEEFSARRDRGQGRGRSSHRKH